MAFLGLGARSQQPNRLGSIQVGTSEYGVAIPVGWGSFKAPIKLLDYTDFVANKVSQSGGKGGGGNNYSYEYYAAVDMLLVRGPIGGVGAVYDSGGASSLVGATEYYTVPAGGGSFQVSNGGYGNTAFYYDEGVTNPVNYNLTANDFGSAGSVSISGTQPAQWARLQTGQPLLARDYNVGNQGLYTFGATGTGASVQVAITYSYTTANLSQAQAGVANTALSPLARFALDSFFGLEVGQQWGYMVSKHPERALGYAGLARILCAYMDLGSGATVPSLSGEVLNGRLSAFGGGVADCDPAVVIADFLGDPKAGCSWPYLGDTTVFSNFCVANNLFMSPFLDSARKALTFLQEICDLANSAPVWSGSTLKIVPYGDTSAAGNNRTYTPPTQPVYIINESELIIGGPGEPAITIKEPDLADNYNRVTFEHTARNDNYNTAIIHEQDEASILMNGLLPMKAVTAHHYCEQLYAAIAMNMMLRRQSVPLRTYSFKLPWYYQLVDAMDIIVLNLATGNLGPTPMRVLSWEESDDDVLTIEAEDFLYGVADGVQYPKGPTKGNQPGAHDLPGATQLLAAFQPNLRVTGGSNQLWLALSGGSSWGGCRVWMSKDGTNYSQIAEQFGSSRAGTLTNALASGSDPDTTDTVAVTVSGSLTGGTQADADSFTTLSLVGSELISYETATLTSSTGSTNSYNLGTYVRRGLFSGNAQAHSAGERFVRLDDRLVKYNIDPVLANATVFLKFTSWNLYSNNEQSLADVAAVQITLAASTAATNMTVSSFRTAGASTATVDVYKQGGAPTDSGVGTLANGASITLPAQAWTGEALATWYGVNFNTAANAYVLYTTQSLWLADQATMLAIGSTTTPAAGSSVFLPSNYDDTGSSTTNNPAGAYTSGQSSVVTGAAFYRPRDPGDCTSSEGVITYFGWAGIAASIMTLSFSATVRRGGIGGTGYASASYTLDGSTWSSISLTSPTATVPAGTNLALVQVEFDAFASAGSGTTTSTGSASITISNLQIA